MKKSNTSITVKNKLPELLSAVCCHAECPEWLQKAITEAFFERSTAITHTPTWFRAEFESIKEVEKKEAEKFESAAHDNIVQFPKVKSAAEDLAEYRTVEMNADTEYAKSFAIDKGDILYLDGFRNVDDGDLILVTINGHHELDTYQDAYTNLEDGGIGVVVGCVKSFKEVVSLQYDPSDDVLLSEVVE